MSAKPVQQPLRQAQDKPEGAIALRFVWVFLICVDITATAFCHCPSFPRKRESREFARYGFPQTGQADSRFRGNDGAENSLYTYVKNTFVRFDLTATE